MDFRALPLNGAKALAETTAVQTPGSGKRQRDPLRIGPVRADDREEANLPRASVSLCARLADANFKRGGMLTAFDLRLADFSRITGQPHERPI